MDIKVIAAELIDKSFSGFISEDELMELTDEKELNNIQFSLLCDELSTNNISIVSDKEYKQLLQKEIKNNVKSHEEKTTVIQYSDIINAFSKLSLPEKHKCLSKLAYIIAQEENNQSNDVKEKFIKTFKDKYLQYSYIAVLIKALLAKANNFGVASVNNLIEYFQEFYSERRNKGYIVEQKDSLFSRENFSKSDIRKVILFNPVKRSFLAEYIFFDKATNNIIINDLLWNSLSEEDKLYIDSIADEKLEIYYNRIVKK